MTASGAAPAGPQAKSPGSICLLCVIGVGSSLRLSWTELHLLKYSFSGKYVLRLTECSHLRSRAQTSVDNINLLVAFPATAL